MTEHKNPRGPGRPRKSEHRSENAREQILLAAGRLFAEKGYEGASTGEIAEAVGLTQPAVFYYFDSKAALFTELANESVDDPLEHLERVLDSDASPGAKLYSQIHMQVTHNLSSPFPLAAVADDAARMAANGGFEEYYEKARRYTQGIQRMLRDGREAGDFRDHDHFVASMAILGMSNWSLRWYSPDGRLSADDIGHGLAGFALCSILAKPNSVDRVRQEAQTKLIASAT